jgi:hypothetical protein
LSPLWLRKFQCIMKCSFSDTPGYQKAISRIWIQNYK